MGRLVRVGSYYIPPPTAVGCSLQKVRWTILLIAHDPIRGKWRPYTLSVFAIANTRDGRGV